MVLSPHLDDAVFSTFKILDRDAVVVTLCTASPAVNSVCSNYDKLTCALDPAQRYRERQVEDLKAAATGGWRPIHYGLLDSPYRLDDPDPVAVAQGVADAVDEAHLAELWIPAGIGGHRDHILARTIGLNLGDILDIPIHFYADLPYATTFGWPGWVAGFPEPTHLDIDAFWQRWLIAEINVRSNAVIHKLDDKMQKFKLEACKGYSTQFPVSEGGPSRLLSHPERICFELSWRIW